VILIVVVHVARVLVPDVPCMKYGVVKSSIPPEDQSPRNSNILVIGL
jgi:hypothetical protein